MKVETILHVKGTEVFAVLDTNTVADAVELLHAKNIGAVVVKSENGSAVGILSERDVVRNLKTSGANLLNASVRACMTPLLHTCSPHDSVDHLMAMMTEKRVRHIPVIDNGEMIGLVSIGDIVKRKIEETEQEAAALKQYIAS